MQGLKSLKNRLETALQDASQQRGLSRSSSRRTSRDVAARQLSRTGSTRRKSLASPSPSLKQSKEGFEANLAAQRSVLPAGSLPAVSLQSCCAVCANVCTVPVPVHSSGLPQPQPQAIQVGL